MILVGFTGPIGHGKSTAAQMLRSQVKHSDHADSGVIAEIANLWLKTLPEALLHKTDRLSMNEWLAALAGIFEKEFDRRVDPKSLTFSNAQMHPDNPDSTKLLEYLSQLQSQELKVETITEANKGTHRAILQWLGGYGVKHIAKGLWYEEIERRFLKAKTDGCELYTVAGIRFAYDAEVITRNGGKMIKIVRDKLVDPDKSDITEKERATIKTDSTIHNNGDLASLQAVMTEIFNDLKLGKLKPEYTA